jgi:hypothetical protein
MTPALVAGERCCCQRETGTKVVGTAGVHWVLGWGLSLRRLASSL